MPHPETKSDTSRRGLLARVGVGTLLAPSVVGSATATQENRRLRASVEPGEGDSDNWTPREFLTDEFRARIRVTGASGGYVTHLAAVLDPTGELIEPRCNVTELRTSSGEIHTDLWYPHRTLRDPFAWPTGRYRLYAMVADSDGNFAAATSGSFEINPT